MIFTVPPEQARAFIHSVAIRATPSRAFRALTAPTELTRWFPVKATLDLRPGGTYEFRFERGTCHGEVLFVAPGDRLSYTWELDAGNAADVRASTLVVFSLRPVEGATLVTLAHSGFGAGGSWEPVYDSHARWWRFFLANLKGWLEEGVDRRAEFFAEARASAVDPRQGSE